MNGFHLEGIKSIRSTDQHQICCLQLILEQFVDGRQVIQIGILLALTLESCGITDWASGAESLPVDNRDHAIHVHSLPNGWPLKGL